MRRHFCAFMILMMIAGGAYAQIESGDTEVGFQGYFLTILGEDIDANGSGSVQVSYGKYLSSKLLIGIAPIMSFSTSEDDQGDPTIETSWSGSVFFNYNFSTASTFIPYITGQYYQFTFDIPEDEKFTDYSYVNVGIGFKNFFNEYAAFNTLVTYGFSLRENAEFGLLTIMTGLSFIF